MKRVIKILKVAVVLAVWLGLGQAAAANEHEGHEHEDSFSAASLVEPLGISTLSSLIITFLAGVFRRKLGRWFLNIHKIFAYLTVVLAVSHGTLVLVLFH